MIASVLDTIHRLGGSVRLVGGALHIEGTRHVRTIASLNSKELVAHLRSRCSHIPPAWRLIETDCTRRSWKRFVCARCGRFIGYRPK